jgi:hypothetical protein
VLNIGMSSCNKCHTKFQMVAKFSQPPRPWHFYEIIFHSIDCECIQFYVQWNKETMTRWVSRCLGGESCKKFNFWIFEKTCAQKFQKKNHSAKVYTNTIGCWEWGEGLHFGGVKCLSSHRRIIQTTLKNNYQVCHIFLFFWYSYVCKE